MGCGGSKLQESEALGLCRSRCDLLAEAIRHRYALAEAHAAYADSLRSVGVALHRVFDGGHGTHPDSSPVLPLPAQRKGVHVPPPSLSPAPAPAPAPAPVHPPPESAIPFAHSDSRSDSGSHIHFHSDDSDSDSDDISPLHSDENSPAHPYPSRHDTLGDEHTRFNIHYAKSKPPPPSVSFEQRVESHEQVHYGSVSEPSSSIPYTYEHSYPTQNPSSHPYPFSYAYTPNYYGMFGSSSPPAAISQSIPGGVDKASTSRAVPPPPSPPRTSTWDFLNPFEAFDSYYPPYTPSRSFKEVREDEGIPELEEVGHEVIKQAYGDKKFAAFTPATAMPEKSSKAASVEMDDAVGSPVRTSSYLQRPKTEDVVVEKNVVGDELQKPREVQRSVVAPRKYHNLSEMASEVRVQFERAAELTKELAKMLEVGKHPYIRKGSFCEVSSRLLCAIPISILKDEDLEYVEDKVMSSGNLSSTLQKLHIWEQKLFGDIRVEEELRLLHDRKTKQLQHMDERGAEAHKIDALQKQIRKLSTKTMIAIQIVYSISTKINVLRDEELWPLIYEVIQGFERMWKPMLDCHRIQYEAIADATYLDSMASGVRLTESHINAVMQLELELLRWIGNFSAWINLQKKFVKALNGWLVLCLHYEPEVTADGIPPYSPGRIGAPPVFVIFNCWSQALDRVSESHVLDAIQTFASGLALLRRKNDEAILQSAASSREEERLQKTRARDARSIHREIESLNRKLVVASPEDDLPTSLHSSLKRVFEAMTSFSADNIQAFEIIRARAEEEEKGAADEEEEEENQEGSSQD